MYALSKTFNLFCRVVCRTKMKRDPPNLCHCQLNHIPLVPRREGFREVDANLCSVGWIWVPDEFHSGYVVSKIVF